jgi:hypothetical protein
MAGQETEPRDGEDLPAKEGNGKEISQFIYDDSYYFESVPETKH